MHERLNDACPITALQGIEKRRMWLHAGQDLRSTLFTKGSLRRVKFDGADLSGTSMFGSFCKNCSFRSANLRYFLRFYLLPLRANACCFIEVACCLRPTRLTIMSAYHVSIEPPLNPFRFTSGAPHRGTVNTAPPVAWMQNLCASNRSLHHYIERWLWVGSMPFLHSNVPASYSLSTEQVIYRTICEPLLTNLCDNSTSPRRQVPFTHVVYIRAVT